MEFPEVKTVISKTGRAEVATDPMSVDFSDFICGVKTARRMDDDQR